MKVILKILDVLYFIFVSVIAYGAFIAEDTRTRTMAITITALLISYFIVNSIVSKRYFGSIEDKKDEYEKDNELALKNIEKMTNQRFDNMNEFKAYVGETNLVSILDKIEGKKAIIRNLIINPYQVVTTEIDVIMIHNSGVYVFESKNMYGHIKGKKTEDTWMCKLPSGKKFLIHNPVNQNERHVQILKDLLAHKEYKLFKSFVVFTDKILTLDIEIDDEKYWNHVVKQSELEYRLNKQISYTPNLLSDTEVDRLKDHLIKYRESFPEAKYKHANKYSEIY